MTVARRTLRFVDYGLTAIVVLLGAVSVWMWLQAAYWGDAYAIANAMTWSLLTGFLFILNHGVSWLAERGE